MLNQSATYKRVLLFFIFHLTAAFAFCQAKQLPGYKIPAKEVIFGNSWMVSASNTWARNNSCELSIGRTFGINRNSAAIGGGPFMLSWGALVADVYTGSFSNPFVGAFIENTNTDFLTGYNIRLAYLQSANGQYRYISPSVGYSLLGFVDITYVFNIPIANSTNIFKGGVNFRVRAYIKRKNWVQKSLS
jgi:hypothetical protein